MIKKINTIHIVLTPLQNLLGIEGKNIQMYNYPPLG